MNAQCSIFATAVSTALTLAACGSPESTEVPLDISGLRVPTSCQMPFTASVRSGPSAGASFTGTLSLDYARGDGSLSGSLVTDSGTSVPVTGTMAGTAIGIQMLTPSGMVSGTGTLPVAGQPCAGELQGPLTGPLSGDAGDWVGANGQVILAQDGRVFFSDRTTHVIYARASASAAAVILAGKLNTPGNVDAAGTAARLNAPYGLAFDDTANRLYVADTNNQEVRQINPANTNVTTVVRIANAQTAAQAAGYSVASFSPRGLALLAPGSLIVTDGANHVAWHYLNSAMYLRAGKPATIGTVDGTGTAARLNTPDLASAVTTSTSFFSPKSAQTVQLGDGKYRVIDASGQVKTVQ
jgi:hypothetical protein